MGIERVDIIDNKAVLNGCVKVWFENKKLQAEFDRNLIKEFDAVNLIEEYMKYLQKTFVKN